MRAPRHPRSAESKFRFLYLGNDLEFIAAMRQVLRKPVYFLVSCSDRGGAMMFLNSDIRYDLMLIDFDWRGKEGLELARLAHSLAHRKDMPMVMVAATRVNGAVKTLARKVGVKKCLTKSPDLCKLRDAIRQLIEVETGAVRSEQ